jgi:hypothetical protein
LSITKLNKSIKKLKVQNVNPEKMYQSSSESFGIQRCMEESSNESEMLVSYQWKHYREMESLIRIKCDVRDDLHSWDFPWAVQSKVFFATSSRKTTKLMMMTPRLIVLQINKKKSSRVNGTTLVAVTQIEWRAINTLVEANPLEAEGRIQKRWHRTIVFGLLLAAKHISSAAPEKKLLLRPPIPITLK